VDSSPCWVTGRLRREVGFAPAGCPRGRLDIAFHEGPVVPRPVVPGDVLIEVKNVTLLDGSRLRFPDAVSERGYKHLSLLQAAVEQGNRSGMLYAVNLPEGECFTTSWLINPAYAERLATAAEAWCRGVRRACQARGNPPGSRRWIAGGSHAAEPTMTLNELRYIVAVARERHFGRAAEACFVSQPTLSVAVRKLEDELGVSLFERGTGEVTVTTVGQQIVERSQRVLEEADGIKHLARHRKDPLAGMLRLGAIHTIGPYLLPRLIPWISEWAPEMPLMIEENFTSTLSERLKRGDLDVILISLPFNEPGVLTRPIYDESFSVLLPDNHPWSGQTSVGVDQLAGEDVLLLGPGHCFRDQVLEVCPNCIKSTAGGNSLQRGLEGDSLETIRCMVASRVGITVLPCSAAAEDRFVEPLVRSLPFTGKAPRRRIALAWRKSFSRLEAVDVLTRAVWGADLPCVSYLDPAGIP